MKSFPLPLTASDTFASVAITAGADVASVSEALGHSDTAVTLRMYTHASEESRKRAAQIFRNAIKDTQKDTREPEKDPQEPLKTENSRRKENTENP